MTFVKPDVSRLYKKIDFVTVYGYTSGEILRVRSVRGRSSCNKSARSFILIVKRLADFERKMCKNIFVSCDSTIDLYL